MRNKYCCICVIIYLVSNYVIKNKEISYQQFAYAISISLCDYIIIVIINRSKDTDGDTKNGMPTLLCTIIYNDKQHELFKYIALINADLFLGSP